jgi:hypothetical protein
MQEYAVALLVALATIAACGGKTQDAVDASADGGACMYQDTRTISDRMCTVSTDCVVVTRQLSCCQEQDEGIVAIAAAGFQSQQSALTSGCPGCGCLAQPQDELGVKGTTFVATCDKGLCTAHAQ